jgi:hypothetical protein
MAVTTDTGIERLRAVAAASNLRSPLGRWFSAHHAEFEKLLRDYRPRWEALVEQFAADGLLKLPVEFNSEDEKVRNVTRRRVVKSTMRTWERARAQLAKKPPTRQPSPGESTPAVRPPAAPVAHGYDLDEDEEQAPIVEPHSRFNLKRPVDRVKPPKGE